METFLLQSLHPCRAGLPQGSPTCSTHLKAWAECDEEAGLLVPHENESWLDGHHQVNAHFLDVGRKDLHAPLDDQETFIFQLEFILL